MYSIFKRCAMDVFQRKKRYFIICFLSFCPAVMLIYSKSHSALNLGTRYFNKDGISHLFSAVIYTTHMELNTKTEESANKYLAIMNTSILSPDAQLILRSVIEAYFNPLVTVSNDPPCKGDRLQGEVEDILCIPRPNFIKDVKNPCWWDQVGESKVLRCLPYFHILGYGKSGSTDLWWRLTNHKHALRIKGTMQKEANWWAWGRYGHYSYKSRPIRSFLEYTSSFQGLANEVQASLLAGDDRHTLFITGDGSPNDISDFRGWPNITQNRGLKLPNVLNPHLMKHFYPDPKFIILIRNPVDRMFSEYFYINGSIGKSVEKFHDAVLKTIEIMAKCINERSSRECFFDAHMYRALPLRIHFFFYIMHIPEWLKLFSRDKFLFIRTEEYNTKIDETLKACFKFLKLEIPDEKGMNSLVRQERHLVNEVKKTRRAMLPQTRRILEEMAKPAMHLLADILGDDRFRMNGAHLDHLK